MDNTDPARRFRTAFAPLCEPFHDAFAVAEQEWWTRNPDLAASPDYRWCETHFVRAFARHKLLSWRDRITPWKLTGRHSQNGALWLSDGNFRVRVLHTWNERDVPPPGSNRARRAFYRNPPLLPGMPTLFGEPNDRLLMLWRIGGSGLPSFRVVRTIGAWSWGANQEADIDFELPSTADELAGLAFEPTDEGIHIEMPLDDQEEDGSAGGLSG